MYMGAPRDMRRGPRPRPFPRLPASRGGVCGQEKESRNRVQARGLSFPERCQVPHQLLRFNRLDGPAVVGAFRLDGPAAVETFLSLEHLIARLSPHRQ